MTALDRGKCPVCRQRVAIRRNDTTREHRRGRPENHHYPLSSDPICEGSGKPATDITVGSTGVRR